MPDPLPRTPMHLMDRLIDLLGEVEEALTEHGYSLEPFDLGIQVPPKAHDDMADALHELRREPRGRDPGSRLRVYTPLKLGGWRIDPAR